MKTTTSQDAQKAFDKINDNQKLPATGANSFENIIRDYVQADIECANNFYTELQRLKLKNRLK